MSRFEYVTMIRSTPELVFAALTDAPTIQKWWYGVTVDCAWKKGAPWSIALPDGTSADTGEILDIDPQRRIAIAWTNAWNDTLKAEGPSRCVFALEPLGDAVKLTVTHESDVPDSKLVAAVSEAWPYTLSNLKSLLETGAIATAFHPGHSIDESLTLTIELPRSPEHVFACLRDVAKWWGGKDLAGRTSRLDDEFVIRHGDVHYSKQKLIEVVPARKLVFRITDSRLAWLERDEHEWTNTTLVFELTPKGERTILRFTHDGLRPDLECYSSCAEGWNLVIKDYLFHYVTEGRVAARLYAGG